MKMKSLLLVFIAVLFASAARSFAGGDVYFLSLPGFTGDATTGGHQGQIVVTGFQYPGVSGSNRSFYVEKGFDSASAGLLMASVSGTAITSGTFYCEKAASEASRAGGRVFTMVFGGLVVESYESFDTGAADPSPAEKVSFSFSTLQITTYPQKGGKGQPVTTPIFSPPMVN